MTVAVDTNVLIDILAARPDFAQSSESALLNASDEGPLVICETVYAELVPNFADQEQLNQFLARTRISLQASSRDALFTAGQAWQRYVASRDRDPECRGCGEKCAIACKRCGRRLQLRQHVIADFLIGGHAVMHAGSLLTRDRGYFGTYFPKLRLV